MRSHAQIDATGENHERHSYRERAGNGELFQHVQPVVGAEEIFRNEKRGDE